MNITDPIRRQARLSPESVAVIRAGNVITYRELNAVIDTLAARFLAMGLRPGDAAGVLVSSRYGHLAMTLALARIGAATAALREPATSMGGVALKACFVDARAATTVAGCITADSGWWRSPAAAREVPPVPSHPDSEAICVIVPSSGTTGVPKAIALSHERMRTRLRARALAIPAPEKQRQLCLLGIGLNYGFSSMLQALSTGGLITLAIKGALHGAIALYQLNYLVMSPAQLHGMLKALPEGAGPFPSLEVVEIGGSLPPPRLTSLARARLCANVYVAYGAGEAGNVACAPAAALEHRPGGVGFLTPGVEVQAVDGDDRPLPAGTEGILRIRSENCVSAYLGDAAASASAFKDGWFYPGDIGSVASDGLLAIAGRSNEIINAGGVKVSPHIIEEAVLTYPDVSEVAAFAAPNAVSGLPEIWIAIVRTKPIDVQALRAFCVERLGRARAPHSILVVKELPRNESGKVLHDRLVKMAGTARKTAVSKKEPPPPLH